MMLKLNHLMYGLGAGLWLSVASVAMAKAPAETSPETSADTNQSPGLVQSIQGEIEGEANGIARAYFIQLGEKTSPLDIGFRSEVFLKEGAGGTQELERILMTAYIPESYPDGMIIDFRANFRKHFEELGYFVIFGPEPGPAVTSAPLFDFRVRRIHPPWTGETATSALIAAQKPPKALIQIFGGRVDLEGIKAIVAPFWGEITGMMGRMGTAEFSMVAGAGAAIAFVLLVMIALAPLRILRRRQQAHMRYRQYPPQRVRTALPAPGEPPLFNSGYREVESNRIDPQVERIRATMAQMGIKEVLEILRNLDPHYRDQVLAGLNVHKSIKSRIEKALNQDS